MAIIIGSSSSISASGSYGSGSPLITPSVATNAFSTFLVFTTNYQYYVGNYTITDSKSNQYQRIDGIVDSTNGGSISAFICKNGVGGSGHTASIGPTTNLNTGKSFFVEIAETSLLESSSNGRFSSSTTYNSGSIAAGSASIITAKSGIVIGLGISSLTSISSATGWTTIDGTNLYNGPVYQTASTAASYSPSFTLGSSSTGAQMLIALSKFVTSLYSNGTFQAVQFIEGTI